MKYLYFRVKIALPDRATHREVWYYISSALNDWWGQLEPPNAYGRDTNTPGDPMWALPRVTVTPIKPPTKGK